MICKEIQNQCEQDIAKYYFLNRKLIKPKTDILTFILLVSGIEIISVVLTYSLYGLFHWFCIIFTFYTLYSFVSIIVFLIFSKKICVALVELYQHYASETTRRRCTLMPSCSEYAILALHKYSVFVALRKIYVRLTKKCNGEYLIDYP